MLKELFQQSNWLAIFIGAAAYWLIGALWYTMFGKKWMVAAGLSKEKIDASSKIIYLYTFLIEVLIVLAMATLINALMITEISEAIQFGILIGLIFSGFTTWVHYMYTSQKKDLFWIDAGYTTLASVVVSVLLVLFL